MPDVTLVTGSQGFIGRYVASSILKSKPDRMVIGVGRSELLCERFSHRVTGPAGPVLAPLPDDLHGAFESKRYVYRQLDVLESEKIVSILEEFRPQKIVHLASGLRGDARKNLFENNAEGTARLFEAAGRIGGYSPVFVLGSSGGVYGQANSEQLPFAEGAPCNPIDEYSISKLSAELLARMLARRSGFRLRIARIFNVIGPGQDERHIAGQIAAGLLRVQTGRQLALKLGTLSSTRDFVDVRDVSSALLLLIQENVPDGIYNVASAVETPIERLLQIFLDRSGLHIEVTRANGRIEDVQRHFADNGRLAGLGFRTEVDLACSVASVWSYYKRLWMD